MTVLEKTKGHFTYEDYAKLPEGAPYQLIGGELIMTPAPNPRHQIISANIFEKIREFAKEFGMTLYSPVDVYFGRENAYQPDIVFISRDRWNIIQEDGIHGAPDLVIEILSHSTARYDLREKFRVYEEHGVKEYWIVDPVEKGMVVYENVSGGFEIISQATKRGRVNSKLLEGFGVELERVF